MIDLITVNSSFGNIAFYVAVYAVCDLVFVFEVSVYISLSTHEHFTILIALITKISYLFIIMTHFHLLILGVEGYCCT